MNYRTPAAQEQGLEEATARNLTAAAPDASLTPAEEAAADFAERLALNHQSVDDGVFEGLRRHFTEQQIVELGWAAAAFIGFGWLAQYWAMSDASRALQYVGLSLYVLLEAVIFVPILCIAIYRVDSTVLRS